jgi:hypothetical protein
LSEAGFSYAGKSLCLKYHCSNCSVLSILSLDFLNRHVLHIFFYCVSGEKNHVICFQCGVQMGEWLDCGDPWIEHAMWSPTCLYVKHLKGLVFVKICKPLRPAEKWCNCVCNIFYSGWLQRAFMHIFKLWTKRIA